MTEMRKLAAGPAIAFTLVLSACGGDSGGVTSTPTPTPTPTPTASYTKIADMTGDRTFQTGGVQYNTGPSGFSNGTNLAFGNGVRVAYTAASDSYTLTAPDNTTVTFNPSEVVQPAPAANTIQWLKRNSSNVVTDQFTLIVPTSGGVALSYTIIGTWGTNLNSSSPTYRIAVGGAPTIASDMPKSGTANYTVGVGGAANLAGAPYNLSGNSTGTFSANFGTGAITTALTLTGTPQPSGGTPTTFGTFNGSGTIASNSPGFTGTISGTASNGTAATGGFSGAFFGPQALEVGFGYTITAGTFSAVGGVSGVKQ